MFVDYLKCYVTRFSYKTTIFEPFSQFIVSDVNVLTALQS